MSPPAGLDFVAAFFSPFFEATLPGMIIRFASELLSPRADPKKLIAIWRNPFISKLVRITLTKIRIALTNQILV